jgi:hypothetical protein
MRNVLLLLISAAAAYVERFNGRIVIAMDATSLAVTTHSASGRGTVPYGLRNFSQNVTPLFIWPKGNLSKG